MRVGRRAKPTRAKKRVPEASLADSCDLSDPLDDSVLAEAAWQDILRSDEVFWGSRFFDSDLNELPGASDDAWLEVRLVRHRLDVLARTNLEVRTRFNVWPSG